MFLPREPRQGQRLDASWGAGVIRYLRSITLRQSIDCDIERTANGTRIHPRVARRGGGAAAPDKRPFDATVSGVDDPRDVKLVPGVVNNLLPTNMFSTLSVPLTGTRYVVLNVTFAGGQVTSSQMAIEAAPPASPAVNADAPPAAAKILIAVIVNGSVFQIRRGNLLCTCIQVFTTDRETPADPGELPYQAFWTWKIDTDAS